MKHIFITALLFVTGSNSIVAQSVAINTTNATANATAMLDVSSTTKGVLIPTMTKAQRNAITTPATGLMVYVNGPDTTGFSHYSGANWKWLASHTENKVTVTEEIGVVNSWFGTVMPSTSWLPLSGGTYDKADYPDFVASGSYSQLIASQTASQFTLKNLNTGAASGGGYALMGLGGNAAGTLQNDATAVNGLGLNDPGHLHNFKAGLDNGGTDYRVMKAVNYGSNYGIINDLNFGCPSATTGLSIINAGSETQPNTARVTWIVRVKPIVIVFPD